MIYKHTLLESHQSTNTVYRKDASTMSDMTDYAIVKVSPEFKERFENLNKEFNLGYGSFTEFARDAMRRRFEELKEIYGGE